MRISTNDIHAHLFAAEAEEEESFWDSVDNDVERVVGGERTVKD